MRRRGHAVRSAIPLLVLVVMFLWLADAFDQNVRGQGRNSRIRGNIIEGNTASTLQGHGSAIGAFAGSPIIEQNVILNNQVRANY